MTDAGEKCDPHGFLARPFPSLTKDDKRQIMVGTQKRMDKSQ